MEREELTHANDAARDMLLMFGGAALVLLGAGLIISNRQVQRYLGDIDINGLAQGAIPDIERYMKLRSM
ncbi:MAG: hypothetical protein H0W08_13885 [Acidobacteria bacterium]|nr:hypothetical protein [Acidobacteriota bacterium]